MIMIIIVSSGCGSSSSITAGGAAVGMPTMIAPAAVLLYRHGRPISTVCRALP